MTYTRKVDARTDIWSLGVVLYELVCGVVPFPGETLTQVVHGVMSLEPAPIRTLVSELPVGLEVVIARCLQKEAAKRYGSVEELSEALGKVLAREPVEDLAAEESLADTVRVGAPDGGGAHELEATDVGSSNSFVLKPLPRLRDSRNFGQETGPKIQPRLRDSRNLGQRELHPATALRDALSLASNTPPSPQRSAAYTFVIATGAIAIVSWIALAMREPDRVRAVPLGSAQPQPFSLGLCDAQGVCIQCVDTTQCTSGTICVASRCISPTCNNGVKDGNESDVDCGVSCLLCASGQQCVTSDDCQSNVCLENVCN